MDDGGSSRGRAQRSALGQRRAGSGRASGRQGSEARPGPCRLLPGPVPSPDTGTCTCHRCPQHSWECPRQAALLSLVAVTFPRLTEPRWLSQGQSQPCTEPDLGTEPLSPESPSPPGFTWAHSPPLPCAAGRVLGRLCVSVASALGLPGPRGQMGTRDPSAGPYLPSPAGDPWPLSRAQ